MISSLLQGLKKALVPVLILGLAIGAFVYLKATKPAQPPVEVKEKVWPVEMMTVTLGDYAPFQVLYGKAESSSMVTAAAPVASVVDQVVVKEGDLVKKGQLLVALNAEDLRLPYLQAKADVADLTAQIRLERINDQANKEKLLQEQKILKIKQDAVERSKKLIAKDLTAQSALDQAKEALARQEYTVLGAQLAVEQHQVKLNQLQAKREKAQAVLAKAKLNQTRGKVVAPYDARIAKVMVSEGDSVGVNSQLVRFYALESLELRAKLPVSKMASVYRDLMADRAVFAEVVKNGSKVRLPLLRLAGESTTSGTDAFFALTDEFKMTRPGDLLKIHLLKQPVENSFAVPYTAIYGSDGLYLVKDGYLQYQQVELLGDILVNGAVWALVKAEVASGAQVSITHLPNAMTGLKVQVMSHE